MRQVQITVVPEGTHFFYDGEEFVVENRNGYPFIETRCISNPAKYDGLGLAFCNFEQVEVADDTKVYRQYFAEIRKNYFGMREELE